tara:strand:- start:753 stop:971 length:219 start_codon:yes stop_codon:yes gene_type:complete
MNSREKANQANAILNNEVFKEIVDNLREGLVFQWSISETTSERELCWMKLNALRSITEDLQAAIHSDKIENN